jgi:succinyl-CoA:acetate CoA-transferase
VIDHGRIECDVLRGKVMTAEAAVELITPGTTIGVSGFTGSGYPKAVPQALAAGIKTKSREGMPFRVNLWTGSSTGPEVDGALAAVDGIAFRMPFQSDPYLRDRINKGETEYVDNHLSCAAPIAASGSMGPLHTALIEVTAIRKDGKLVPSSSVGNNQSWLYQAKQVILEVNSWQSADLEGMHDIYTIARPPHTRPIRIQKPDDRIGVHHLAVDMEKVVAVVETDIADRNSPLAPPDPVSLRIAANIINFLSNEVRQGRLPASLLPLHLGIGAVSNAVLAGLKDAQFESMTAYTEVVQDGMLDLLDCGKLSMVSATALSFSHDHARAFNADAKKYRNRIVLRPQDVSNSPEVIRRLGCIAMNPFLELDIYGFVNSTHVMGSWMMNGIGGSGDFARSASLSLFMGPSVANGGKISAIVPMCSHMDHAAQDVMVVVTEQGVADLRGKSPKQRAETIINNCAHPDYRPLLLDYYKRAKKTSTGLHAPCMLDEVFSWHDRFVKTGTMLRR